MILQKLISLIFKNSLMLNKKGLEEQGMHFSTGRITKIILFLIVVALATILLIPRMTSGATNETLTNFGSFLFQKTTSPD